MCSSQEKSEKLGIKRWQRLLERMSPEDENILNSLAEKWEKTGTLEFLTISDQKCAQLSQILEFNKTLGSHHDLDSLLTAILDKAIEITKAERGFIILGLEGRVAIARNFDKEWVNDAGGKISRSLAGTVLATGKAILTPNAQDDPEVRTSGSVRQLGLRSVLCVPFKAKDQILGALYLDNRFCQGAFQIHHCEILQAYADQASIALYNARLLETLEKKDRQMEEIVRARAIREREEHAIHQNFQETGELAGIFRFGDMISRTETMSQLFHLAMRAAQSDVPVLITGESGTGKSLIAKAIHIYSLRKDKAFIAENCAAISETLLESELFGYVRGAFTGAIQDHKGLFDLADKGTLFLDEVGDMSLEMQSSLLKVLETGMVRPVGGQQWHQVDARLICATNQNLPEMIQNGKFRQDLWYRLRVLTLHIPPIRERGEDIPILINFFLKKHGQEERIEIEPATMELLMKYRWPGNIRQLEHEIKRIIVLKRTGEKVSPRDLSPEIAPQQENLQISSHLALKEAVRRFEHNYILRTIRELGGNKKEAAKVLGLSRRTLYNKLEESKE